VQRPAGQATMGGASAEAGQAATVAAGAEARRQSCGLANGPPSGGARPPGIGAEAGPLWRWSRPGARPLRGTRGHGPPAA